jgi:hypothetical protein
MNQTDGTAALLHQAIHAFPKKIRRVEMDQVRAEVVEYKCRRYG